ncbi:5-methyltetrahydropteroyltriglutamate--homocysteine methyltransferase [Natronobacillus azotifigens]|uniref:5-methyltetrahydropteroyltriglutamate--homocysteine methyltransferase n=1 Tax=Natronobacillus azotifigens TaxID=472978 RepID=A0A9J6R9D5_9BACI|nr:5-methyltetrahydropteroyltriglutamate--homocysteine S-methyltransferase [Natronobacillus azotifigens]MCZ0702290.1 5-methyltetrahydropteroyltriglutamate--homocysteine S-methyltransferase [Natronobacillus azotifigens]
METSVIGYPRVGALRELKFATENYLKNHLTKERLQSTGLKLREAHWKTQQSNGVDFITSNDFSFYDNMLDTAVLLNVVPERYRKLGLDILDEYFAMARGYQGEKGDVKALAMKKWFNTNYHYMVPEMEDETKITLAGTKPFDEYLEAKKIGIETKPSIIGPFTFLKLTKFSGQKEERDFISDIIQAYVDIIQKFEQLGTKWIQFEEPALVMDIYEDDKKLVEKLYRPMLSTKGKLKVLLQTYFGDLRDCYREVTDLPFDGIGLDFVEGNKSLNLIKKLGFPKDKKLFVGIVNGKNIWRNNYATTVKIVKELAEHCEKLVLSTACSLLHVPYTLKNENKLLKAHKKYFAFADEKITELSQLKIVLSSKDPTLSDEYKKNIELFSQKRAGQNSTVQSVVSTLHEQDFVRHPNFEKREKIQKSTFDLPLLPTTTIGSLPQTTEVKENRSKFKKGKISFEQYTQFNKEKIAEWVSIQEKIGLDVLVHGEFERNDMVEYFGENLDGFLFTENAWVQSYGTRCVKPPIIWGDISRSKPITVNYSVYAQSLTKKALKGMLTGPVTILNWSFPREDISLKDCAFQISLAIKAEVLDLEANGIRIIQIDEAALREKLPLRQSDWHSEYLDWAIPAFRLVHSSVKPDTQIHTHMCYSEFKDIIKNIDAMDADVITFEAARSDLSIVDVLKESGFKTEVGPGVYDIHSPRIPAVEEIKEALEKILTKIPLEKLWVNPDCGLKTRGENETIPSLENLVAAAQKLRERVPV